MPRIFAFLSGHTRPVLLGLAAALIWMGYHERWSRESWNIPTDYYLDAHETLARLQAAAEGLSRPLQPQVVDRLGAPFGAHWDAYPTPDKPLMLALSQLVGAVGLFAAANIGLMLAQVSAAIAFYLVARWLRCRWEWAAAGALLFAYTYHSFHRGLSHFSLVFTWTVPLGLFAVWQVARSRRIHWRRPAAIACLGAAVALGVANPYNLFFWLQLMAWAMIQQAVGGRRRENLQIGGATILVAVLAFLAVNAEGWLFVDDTGALPLLARNYAGTEMYALKAMEMFVPPPFHQWDWLAFFGHRYTRWSGWRGEVFLPYLGLVGIAGLLWLIGATVRRVLAGRPPPGAALPIGWILAYATVGGVTNLLALFASFQLFRATNRAAIFISAIVLFFLIQRLSRLSGRWPAGWRLAVPAALAVIGLVDQLPRREDRRDREAIARAVASDRELGRRLEASLPPGAMVFQLPVLGFPEVATPYALNDYEHFRPYLATTTLRFSYGAPKYRARSRWQQDLAGRPMAEVVPVLEASGFAALYINRKGYGDRAEALLRELRDLGYARLLQGDAGDQVIVRLRPMADPILPLGRALTFGRGWHLRSESGVRWAYEDAALSYFNPYPHPIDVSLELTVDVPGPRDLVLEMERRTVAKLAVEQETGRLWIPRLSLAPGVSRFVLRSPAAAIRQGQGQYQLRSFGVREATVVPLVGDLSPFSATARAGRQPPRAAVRSE